MFDTPPGIVVCDASFISLKLILPNVLPLAARDASLVALIKPHSRRAATTSARAALCATEAVHARVCDEIVALVRQLGWRVEGVRPSPIEGGDGNKEFLLCAKKREAP